MSSQSVTVDQVPALIETWDFEKNLSETPENVASKSHKDFWWKCEKGHSWISSVYARRMGDGGCPICSNKQLLAGVNDLATTRPDLAAEWNESRNAPLKPSELFAGTAKKVWWKCQRGHEWEASCAARSTRNQGCPYCSGRRAIQGETDLASRNPRLVAEWNRGRNGSLLPSEISSGSSRKVWWQCEKGHEWEAAVYKRQNGSGCPFCSGRRVSEGESDILTLFPNEMKLWHPTRNDMINPSQISPNSKTKVWWICEGGHDFLQSPRSRLLRQTGCPACSKRVLVPAINDLATTNPDVASEWHPSLNSPRQPSEFVAGSNHEAWWICGEGHAWQARIFSRAVQRSGCPFCGNRDLWEGFNDLATIRPELATEWHPHRNGSLLPSKVTAGSSKKAWWLCKKGHEWKASCAVRLRGTGCPVCSNQKVQAGYNDLESRFPDLAKEWDSQKNGPLAADAVVFGSNKKVWWLCVRGHSWEASVASRSIRGNGCASCRGKRLVIGENDFSTTDPALANQWHPTRNGSLLPSEVVASSKEKVWWLCDKGHEYQTSVGSRHAQKTGCPYCSGTKVLEGFNDLATTHPDLMREWHPTRNEQLLPTSVQRGTRRKAWWLCPSGHEWEASIANRVWGNACPYCAGQWLLVGVNDLASRNPELSKEWHPTRNNGVEPSQVFGATGQAFWWICSEGHEWKAKVSNRKWGNGCPGCSKAGYLSTTPGLLYLIEHREFFARKIGIANTQAKKNRVKEFLKAGWEQIFELKDQNGQIILDLETQVLRWIRQDLGLPPYLSRADMTSTGGASETFSADGISNYEVIQKITEIHQRLSRATSDRGRIF